MRCIDGENELILTCETQAEGVCILRCETRDPVVLLPDEIDGAPVTALGRYVLSGRAPRPLRPGHVFRARDLRRPAPRARSGQHPRSDAAEARQNRRQLCVLQLPLARGADYDGQRFRV